MKTSVRISVMLLIVNVLLSVLSTAHAAKLDSLTPEIEVVIDGVGVSQHTVICSDESRFKIQRIAGERKWCDARHSDVCFPDRKRTARAVCQRASDDAKSSPSTQLVVVQSNESTKATKDVNDEKAQIKRALEAELSQIEQQRVELRSRIDSLEVERLTLVREQANL